MLRTLKIIVPAAIIIFCIALTTEVVIAPTCPSDIVPEATCPEIVGKDVPAQPVVHDPKRRSDGEYLFVPEKYRDLAKTPVFAELGTSAGGVIFLLPKKEEMSLIAPVDGYVHMYFREPGKKKPKIVFSDVPWDMDYLSSEGILEEKDIHAVFFESAAWISVKEGFVKAGEVIGVTVPGDEIYAGRFTERANFGIMPAKWIINHVSDCDDPSAYMTSVMEEFDPA